MRYHFKKGHCIMKLFIIFLAVLGISIADQVSYEGFKVFSVTPTTDDQKFSLKKWEDINGIDFWEQISAKYNVAARIMVSPDLQLSFQTFLDDLEIEHFVAIENVESVFIAERKTQEEQLERLAKQKLESKSARITVDFNHYWRTDEINEYIDQLAFYYADILTIEIVGSSYEGKLIRAVKVSINGQGNIDGSRPVIIVDSGIHAREWITNMFAMKMLHELVEHNYDNLDILENVDWVFIPNANPDGYEYSHNSDRLWRRTRSYTAGSVCYGVDGNRNYEFQWRLGTNPCSEIYSGQQPFQEGETQAVRTVIDRYGQYSPLYSSIHSYGNWVLYPWGYDFINIDNWEDHHYVGTAFANAIQAATGRVYTVGNAAILLYPAYGASDDYVASRGVTLSYTLELPGGGIYGFDLPASQIQGVVDETWLGYRQFGLHVAQNYTRN